MMKEYRSYPKKHKTGRDFLARNDKGYSSSFPAVKDFWIPWSSQGMAMG
jgi:hypothetical protein